MLSVSLGDALCSTRRELPVVHLRQLATVSRLCLAYFRLSSCMVTIGEPQIAKNGGGEQSSSLYKNLFVSRLLSQTQNKIIMKHS